MTLPAVIEGHKALLVALVVIGRLAARALGRAFTSPVDSLAEAAAVPRTYVYEVVRRVVAALEGVAATPPGRPHGAGNEAPAAVPAPLLTIAVLRYRAEHAGAVCSGHSGTRTEYSPAFRRFVLRQHDDWAERLGLEDFARAVELPLDTLRDWLAADRQGLTPPPPPPPPSPRLPEDPAPLVVRIAELFAAWEGSTRAFLRHAAASLGLAPGVVLRVLVLLCLIPPRRPRHLPPQPRYRGETRRLSPGAVLVTDGKTVVVELTASGTQATRNWQPMVDQASACVTGSAVSREETAAAAIEAYRESLAFLSGHPPQAVVHDGKPCYQEGAFRDAIAPATPIPASPARGQNKAVIEGLFGQFEQQVGTLRLDDSSPEALITSAVREVLRAFVTGMNHAGRAELGGRSRSAYLRHFVPSPAEVERDRRFLETLRARHTNPRRARELADSRRLLDEAFARYACLRGRDPSGNLRRHLAYCDPSAVRQALAIFATKVEQGALDPDHAHRYLATLVKNCQNEFELQRCEAELLELTAAQGRWWTAALEDELRELERGERRDAAREIAARAAFGGLPVEGAFWTAQMLACVRRDPDLSGPVRAHLVRLYEAPVERRLVLLDLLAALARGLH